MVFICNKSHVLLHFDLCKGVTVLCHFTYTYAIYLKKKKLLEISVLWDKLCKSFLFSCLAKLYIDI